MLRDSPIDFMYIFRFFPMEAELFLQITCLEVAHRVAGIIHLLQGVKFIIIISVVGVPLPIPAIQEQQHTGLQRICDTGALINMRVIS
jgi:hypothetical protein